MGFLNTVSALGRKLWDGIKKPLSSTYHWLKDGMSSLHNAGSWIDNKLSALSSVPIVGEFADMVRMNPLYQEVGSILREAEGFLNLGGDIGRDIGRAIDYGLNDRGRGSYISPVSGGLRNSNALTERSIPNISPLSGGGNSFAIA